MASDSQSRSALAYRDRKSSWIDRWLFILVFIIGSSSIIALKEFGFEQWIVTSTPVAIMIVYAWYVGRSRRYMLREDQAGDNLYYLGFLYTLVSLSYSLFVFAGEEESTQKIIGNFGLALATTIVGLGLRVLFTQMREDPVEIEREARLVLGEAVSRLKAELDTSVIELNSFRRATVQSLTEGMAEISTKSNTVLEAHTTRLTKLVEKVVESLDEGFSTLKENQKEQTAAWRRTVNAVDQLVQRVEAINVPSDLIERTLAPALDAVDQLVQRVEAINVPSDLIERKLAPALDAVDQLVQRVEAIDVPSDLIERKLAPALDALAEGVREIAGHSHAQTENTERLIGVIESAVRSSRHLDQRLAALVKESEDQRQDIATEIEGLGEALANLRSAAQDSLEDLKDRAGQHQAILRTLTASTEAHLKIAETHRNGLEQELKKSRALVSELHEALVSMTRLMVDRLDGS